MTFILDNKIVDIIAEADLWDEQHGIIKSHGRCFQDLQTEYAYRIIEGTNASVVTSAGFPEGFSQDFSILLVVRPLPGIISSKQSRFNYNRHFCFVL